jgi:hypothetical protein
MNEEVRSKTVCGPTTESRDSAVGIATGYGMDDQGVGVRVPLRSSFPFSMSSKLAVGPIQPPIQSEQRYISSGLKRPVRDAGHSPATSAEVKKTWVYTSTPTYVFMV